MDTGRGGAAGLHRPAAGFPGPPVEPVSAGRLDRAGLWGVTSPTDAELIERSIRDPGCFSAILTVTLTRSCAMRPPGSA